MRIIPKLINVHYDLSAQSTNREKPLEKIEIIDDLIYDNIRNVWVARNYQLNYSPYAGKNVYSQVGFLIEADSSESYKLFFEANENVRLEQDTETSIWYQVSKFEKGSYSTREKDEIAGINQAGYLVAVLESNNTTTKETILFMPSHWDVSDYEAMINELIEISIKLMESETSNIRLARKETISFDWVREILDILIPTLKYINQFPAKEIINDIEKKRPKNERFQIDVEVQKKIMPGMKSLKHRTLKLEENVYEHRMIKQFLMNVRNFLSIYYDDNLIQSKIFNSEMDKKLLIEKSNMKYEKNTYENVRHVIDGYKSALRNEVNMIKSNLSDILNKNFVVTNHELDTEMIVYLSGKPKNIKCRRNGNLLETTFWADFDKTNNSWDISLQEYQYRKLGFMTTVNYTNEGFSQKFQFTYRSSDIYAHYHLISLLESGNIKSIHGIASGYELNTTINTDIVGVANGSRYKNYHFVFKDIKFENRDVLIDEITFKLVPYMSTSYNYLFDQIGREEMKLSSYKEQQRLDNQIVHLKTEQTNIQGYMKEIDELLKLELFQIDNDYSIETLRQTQLFLHDPYYRKCWNVMKEHDYLNVLDTLRIDKLSRFQITNVNNIYETWVFIKMVVLLEEELGWKIEDKKSLQRMIQDFINGKNKEKDILRDFNIVLKKFDYTLTISNTPKLKRAKSGPLEPDYRFIIENDFFHKVIYIDAKNRDYNIQGESEWIRDIQKTAIHKYLRTYDTDLNKTADVSFIVHSDKKFAHKKELEGTTYDASYDKRMLDKNQEICLEKSEFGHRVGSISLLPSFTSSYLNWFRMIMEYHFFDYEHCWKCGAHKNDVEIITAYTQAGLKKYHLTCQKCDNFWVKVHCRNGHTLIKNINNYHKQGDNKDAWFVICPKCFDGDRNLQSVLENSNKNNSDIISLKDSDLSLFDTRRNE